MFRRLLTALGIVMASNVVASGGSVEPTGLHHPYKEPHVNFLYNLLFCDDFTLLKNKGAVEDAGVWRLLREKQADKAALVKVASNESNEGRIRAFAYNRLRSIGAAVPSKKLLGVIVEVPLEDGLDVLAAFSEGGVRYLNQSGKIAVFEGEGTRVAELAKGLISAAQPIVDKIGPWDQQRLPPPKLGNVRITFLVSDGLYFGEGPFEILRRDQLAGPVLFKATQLLQEAVEVGLNTSRAVGGKQERPE